MSLTASTLITTALQRTFGVRGAQKVSKAALLAELSAQDDIIVKMFSQCAPELLTTQPSLVSVVGATNITGYTLTAGIHYRNFVHVDVTENRYTPITLVRREAQDAPPRNPAGYLVLSGDSGVFYPCDPDRKRWAEGGNGTWFDAGRGHKIGYAYVPATSQLTSLSSTLRSPDMAREALLASLVLAIVIDAPGATEVKVQAAAAARQEAFEALRMQAYKFHHPAGTTRGADTEMSEAEWVAMQVGG